MDGLFWIDPYPDEPLGPGAHFSPDDKWTVYGDGMTFRWKGGRSIYICDQCRNFRLFEIWMFSNTIPTLEEAQRAPGGEFGSIKNGRTRIPGATWAMKTRRCF